MKKLPMYTCLRCGHEWHPRTNRRPIACGKCKSPYWNTPRKEQREQEKKNT